VIFNELPSANLSGTGTVCPGEVVNLEVTLTGQGPWDFIYSVEGEEEPSIFTSDPEFTISTTQPGTYVLVEVSDSNCPGTVSGVVEVGNYETPTATIGGDGDVCENSGDGPVVEFTGQPPFSFTYSIDQEEFIDPITTSNFSYTIPAEADGTYELVSFSDANCEGTTQGALEVTILEAPTAFISGGGTVCEGDEAEFEVELTGNGPWSIIYEVGGVPQDPINTSDNSYIFTSGLDGDYVIAQVTDQNCQGEVITSQAELQVNPLPTAEIISNEDQLCIGQELELIYDLQGTPPFEMTYILDEDTITASGITSDYFLILQPTEPVFTQVLFVQDSSNPVCQNAPENSKFIPVGELPNAPEVEDQLVCADAGQIDIGVEPVEGLDYSWSPTTFLSDPDKPITTFEPDEFEPFVREYTYVLTATNGDCSADDTLTITVDPGPRARFTYSPDPVNSVDTEVRFSNNSIAEDYTMYFWTFDSLGTSQEENPVFKFPEGVITTYTITLLAIDPVTGCSDELTEILEIKPEMLVFVPNAFTPDGDGINDLWGPVMRNIDEDDYLLTVYDRYGQVVFSTRDVNQKWNGSTNGDDYYVKSDVYVWQIETKNLLSLEEIDFKGTVTVIR
jgi:gliding motility-associated-like protein